MRAHGAYEQHGTADEPANEVETTTFTVGLPRWPVLVRLRGRDPLVRKPDRIEAFVLVMGVVISLLVVPIVGAIGTTIYDSRHQHYSEQTQGFSTVLATITEDPETVNRTGTAIVPARWSVTGTEHTGTVTAKRTADIGDTVEIWVDNNGTAVPEPTSTGRAAVEAVTATLLMLMVVTGTASLLCAVTRRGCDRIRFARWQNGLDSLVDHGDGQTRSHP